MDDWMIDADRVKRKLADLKNYCSRLERITPKSLELYLKSDIVVKSAVERNLQLVSDSELDIMVQIYKGLELRIAGDDESILDRLEEKLGKATIAKVRERRRLRNDLIHAYSDSDFDKPVFEQAHNLSDVESLRREATRILKAAA